MNKPWTENELLQLNTFLQTFYYWTTNSSGNTDQGSRNELFTRCYFYFHYYFTVFLHNYAWINFIMKKIWLFYRNYFLFPFVPISICPTPLLLVYIHLQTNPHNLRPFVRICQTSNVTNVIIYVLYGIYHKLLNQTCFERRNELLQLSTLP